MGQEKHTALQLTLNQRLKQGAQKLKNEVLAMYFVMKYPETPRYGKVLTAIIVGYALSPIDLIPDFVPILGYMDDVILLPLGIAFVIKIIPSKILDACRESARTNPPIAKPKIWAAAYVIAMLWLIALYALYRCYK